MSQEPYAPSPKHREPWFLFLVRGMKRGGERVDVHADWASTLRSRAERLYLDRGRDFEGFEPPPLDAGQCHGEVSCQVDRALARLRREVPFDGFRGDWAGRQARAVLGSGRATHHEKARLLWWMLGREGIEARFAFTARYLEGHVDLDAPYAGSLDHTLLFLPRQPGLGEALWVDPSCEYCRAGEIPDWDEGSEAMILGAERDLLGRLGTVRAERWPVRGKPAVAEHERWVYRAALDPAGNAQVDVAIESTGRAAQGDRMSARGMGAEEWKRSVEKSATERVANASLERFDRLSCDEDGRICRRSFQLEALGYAAEDGDELVVPLTLLRSSWDADFRGDDRVHDLDLWHRYDHEERLEIVAPEGWVARSVPDGSLGTSAAIDTKVEVVAEGRGVVITRRVIARRGHHSREVYPAVREAMRGYERVRQAVVVFSRTPGN